MSNYLPVPTDAQLHYKPEDHSWLTEELSGNFFAQASYIVNPDDISISLSAANINVDLDQTNASIQTVNANLSGVGEALIGIDIDLNTNLSIVNSNLSTVNTNLSGVGEALIGIDIDLNTNLSIVNSNLSTVNTNLSGVGEALIGIDIDLNTNLSIVNSNLSSVNTNLGNLLNYNSFVIPPFDNIAITNDGDGNPIQYDYSKNSTVVATLSCTYDGSGYLTNIQQIL